MKRMLFILAVVLVLVSWCQPAQATGIAIGVISYDPYFNVGTGMNLAAFNISNLTGAYSLPPDFNVVSLLNITNASLTLAGPSSPGAPISVGTVAPGFLLDSFGNPLGILQFDPASLFTSAILTGTLDTSTLVLADGSTVTVNTAISVTMLPSTGSSLVAGTDFAIIYAYTTTVAEPGVWILLTVGLLALLFAKGLTLGRGLL